MPDVDAPGFPDRGEEQRRLAVLIDADNAQPLVIEGLLGEVARFGLASVKRIYGDWTTTRHSQWKQVLLEHSINPIQQFSYTNGKNATDSSMIIDAMDLLYSRRLDGFCLVSSDSDFTRLAQRLREAGMVVYGFGEQKTPKAFVAACDKFIYTEVLRRRGSKSGWTFVRYRARTGRIAEQGRLRTRHPGQALGGTNLMARERGDQQETHNVYYVTCRASETDRTIYDIHVAM